MGNKKTKLKFLKDKVYVTKIGLLQLELNFCPANFVIIILSF